MEFIVISHTKTKIPITKQERDLLLEASLSGSQVFLLDRTGEAIPLRPMPAIELSERHEKKEKPSRSGVLLSGGQYLPTVEELGFVPTEDSERKRIAYEGMRTKFLEGKTIPRLTEAEQLEASKEMRERANS